MANYEIVAVLRPDLEEDAIETAIGRIHQRITENGGSVTNTDRWGKRRLAYAIQKYRDGYYVFSVFSLQSPQVSRVRQTIRLNEDLLRFVVADHHPAPPRPAPAAAGQTAAAATAPAATPAPAAASSTPAPVPASAPAGGDTPAAGGEGGDV